MTDFYAEMAGVTAELLASTSEGGLGQGEIVLVRYTAGSAPANEWDAPTTPTRTELTLAGAAKGVSEKFIGTMAGSETIVGSDLEVIVAPFAGGYDPGDVLEIDSNPVTVLSVQNIPAAGTVSAVRFIVRG